jgi:hypothetical protein
MTASKLIEKFPPFGYKDRSIEDVLCSYGGWITQNSESKKYLTKENIQEIDSLIRSILKANECFLTGQVAESYKIIYEILFSKTYSRNIYHSQKLDSNNIYYRMRSCKDEYLFSKEELFHIPFDQRQKTSNQRYSLTGYPCLYLGRSIYVCWEELNRPRFDNANIVGVKNLRELQLLDLRMPTEIKDANDLYRIPLIIACSINVQEPNLPFKPEYVISQAILHAIINHNNKYPSSKNLNGIMYYSTSTNHNQKLFNDIELFENIVIPTVNNTKDPEAEKIYQNGFCPVLCNAFEITAPISFNTYRLSIDSKNNKIYSSKPEETKPYSMTEMALLEEYIKTLETHKISPHKFFRLNPKRLEHY